MIFLELGKMQFNIWRVAYNPVPWIENIDSINNFFDIQHVIQEAANETDFKKLRFYLNTPVSNLHFGVHELLMSLETWASGEVPRASNIWEFLAQRASWNINVFQALYSYVIKLMQ